MVLVQMKCWADQHLIYSGLESNLIVDPLWTNVALVSPQIQSPVAPLDEHPMPSRSTVWLI